MYMSFPFGWPSMVHILLPNVWSAFELKKASLFSGYDQA
jgi:hypothetical protein